MAILRVAQLGEPVLRRRSNPVRKSFIRTSRFRRLVEDLVDTMRDAGGVGIAAPQIFVSSRVLAIEVRDVDRYRDAEILPLVVVANPRLTILSPETALGWEGCLSIDGLRGHVPRHRSVRVDGLDVSGAPTTLELQGFPAIVAQHEIDHLDGLVYLDRMPDLESLAFEREYQRYHLAREAPADVDADAGRATPVGERPRRVDTR